MKVFKFGGASVKDAASVRNVGRILADRPDYKILVVVSAMGKTTNMLEGLTNSHFRQDGEQHIHLEKIQKFHLDILEQLFTEKNNPIHQEIHTIFVEIERKLADAPHGTFNFEYDQMVAMGEMLSTKIVHAHLSDAGIANKWFDVRDLIRTDNNYRQAKVDWETSEKQIKELLGEYFKTGRIGVTQGFVGGTSENFTSTLGREGSDYSAAIFANVLDAEEVVIWKDVEGMLNADPKFFPDAKKLDNISYLEAVELAYYGASVIHPKTIKPLENKKIPLFIKSFIKPTSVGSLIDDNAQPDSLIPSFIFKEQQTLLSISSKDYSFIDEKNLSHIFGTFSKLGICINLMQVSAISFSVCFDRDEVKFTELLPLLQIEYRLIYNDKVELLTIRHYNEAIVEKLLEDKEVLVEQRSRNTARFVLKTMVNG